MMHGREKSDLGIVAVKSANNSMTCLFAKANKTAQAGAESMELRVGAKENASQSNKHRTQCRRFLLFRLRLRVCPNDWIVYEREQKVIRQNGLRRCCPVLLNMDHAGSVGASLFVVKTGCGVWNRRDLCGGCAVRRIPTAMVRAQPSEPA